MRGTIIGKDGTERRLLCVGTSSSMTYVYDLNTMQQYSPTFFNIKDFPSSVGKVIYSFLNTGIYSFDIKNNIGSMSYSSGIYFSSMRCWTDGKRIYDILYNSSPYGLRILSMSGVLETTLKSGVQVKSFAQDENNIYIVTGTSLSVYQKYTWTDITTQYQSVSCNSVFVDKNEIYLAGSGSYTSLVRINKETKTIIATFNFLSSIVVYTIESTTSYIFVGCSNSKIPIIRKSDNTNINDTGQILNMASYVVSKTNGKIYIGEYGNNLKIHIANEDSLSFSATSMGVPSNCLKMVIL